MASNQTVPLPTVPDGYNPFEYWQLFSDLYMKPTAGFGARLIVLLCIVSYSLLAAVVLLGIHTVDYRRRKMDFWLWRVVRSRDRRVIVGNQHFLTPLFCMFTSCVFIGALANDWTGLYKRGSLTNDGAWQLAPWAALFVMQWVVSWAALQAFVLVSADSVPDWAIVFSNVFFVAIGVVELGAMVAFVVMGTINGKILWRVNERLVSFLQDQSPTWSASTPISSPTLNQATNLWSAYINRVTYSLVLTRRVLILFVIAALITALVNCGSLGTVFIVRRQIKLGYTQFAGLRTAASILVPDEAGRRAPHLLAGGEEEEEEMAQVGFQVTPATPALHQDAPMADSPPAPLSAGNSRRPSLIRLPSSASASHLSHSGASRAPSRAKVRALATQEDGGLRRERAKNLQRLQRAEADLLTTGVAMAALSVSVAVLGIWTIVLIPKYEKGITWAAYETALLGGTWIYSFINAVSISIQIWTAWLNLSAPEPSLGTPGAHHTTPTGTGGTVSIVVPNPRHLPDSAGELSFEGMLASAPVTPTHEKSKFNFGSRRGSAQSNSSLGPVAEEGVGREVGGLDLGAFARA